jgi:hypothetical protein
MHSPLSSFILFRHLQQIQRRGVSLGVHVLLWPTEWALSGCVTDQALSRAWTTLLNVSCRALDKSWAMMMEQYNDWHTHLLEYPDLQTPAPYRATWVFMDGWKRRMIQKCPSPNQHKEVFASDWHLVFSLGRPSTTTWHPHAHAPCRNVGGIVGWVGDSLSLAHCCWATYTYLLV